MSSPIVSDHTSEEMYLDPGMMIWLSDVSVRYRAPDQKYGTFKEFVIRRLQGRVEYREFWALKGVSLEVRSGEVYGIIGVNGAGKSTLLKVVSRVLKPVEGRVVVKGYVAPLLELGAGFHPELTGRENVYLNGSLLGHSQEQIDQKFDRILEFADIGSFIEAPIRTYSTGMVARLGFAVATAWDPDVLIIDEVLAVGDEAFQEKCRSRIEHFRDRGVTVLLVSHNLALIEGLCQRAAWLDHGEFKVCGDPSEVVSAYRQG